MRCWRLCFIFLAGFLFFGTIPVFAQAPASAPSRTHIVATFFMGGEYIFYDEDYDWGVGSKNGTIVGVNVLFIGNTGFTISAGANLKFELNVGSRIDPVFGMGYVYYDTFFAGGILNLMPRPYIGSEVFLAPTFIGGYDFGSFIVMGDLSYMFGLGRTLGFTPRDGFRFSLGVGVSVR